MAVGKKAMAVPKGSAPATVRLDGDADDQRITHHDVAKIVRRTGAGVAGDVRALAAKAPRVTVSAASRPGKPGRFGPTRYAVAPNRPD